MVGEECGPRAVYIVWFEVPADAGRGSIWAFLSVFPDVKKQEKKGRCLKALNNQTLKKIITINDVVLVVNIPSKM